MKEKEPIKESEKITVAYKPLYLVIPDAANRMGIQTDSMVFLDGLSIDECYQCKQESPPLVCNVGQVLEPQGCPASERSKSYDPIHPMGIRATIAKTLNSQGNGFVAIMQAPDGFVVQHKVSYSYSEWGKGYGYRYDHIEPKRVKVREIRAFAEGKEIRAGYLVYHHKTGSLYPATYRQLIASGDFANAAHFFFRLSRNGKVSTSTDYRDDHFAIRSQKGARRA